MLNQNRKRLSGKIVSNNNPKTVRVEVLWSQRDRIYKKSKVKIKRIVAHDENSKSVPGDTVIVESSRPLSATKRWKIVKIVNR